MSFNELFSGIDLTLVCKIERIYIASSFDSLPLSLLHSSKNFRSVFCLQLVVSSLISNRLYSADISPVQLSYIGVSGCMHGNCQKSPAINKDWFLFILFMIILKLSADNILHSSITKPVYLCLGNSSRQPNPNTL